MALSYLQPTPLSNVDARVASTGFDKILILINVHSFFIHLFCAIYNKYIFHILSILMVCVCVCVSLVKFAHISSMHKLCTTTIFTQQKCMPWKAHYLNTTMFKL